MYNHFTSNNLITKNQSGFRPNDSVTNQLICLVDSIHSSLDINLNVRSVFLDMSKAFDKVGHEGLLFNLNKMELMEIRCKSKIYSNSFYPDSIRCWN